MVDERIQHTDAQQVDGNGEYKFLLIPGTIVLILVIIVVLASYFNYHTYFFKLSDGKLEMWHGDFAPLGCQLYSDFEPLPIDHHDFSEIVNKKYQGIERAYGALYDVFIGEAEEELDNGCEADLKKVDHSIALADKFFPLCYTVNPGYARTRFEISWKKVETLKDLLSDAYQDSLDHMGKIQSLGVSKELDLEDREKEANAWLKDHPLSP